MAPEALAQATIRIPQNPPPPTDDPDATSI